MKKFVKVFFSFLIVLFAFLMLVPLFFEKDLKELVVKQANSSLQAELNFNKLGLSLLRHFPDATLSLKDMQIVGKENFKNDTLLQATDFSITIDALSLINSKVPVIKSIIIQNADIRLKVLENGEKNWDIFVPDSVSEEVTADTSNFKIEMNGIVLDHSNFSYVNDVSKIIFRTENIHAEAKGDFQASVTDLLLLAEIERVDYSYDGITFMQSVHAQANGQLKADFNQFRFDFVNDDLKLNDLSLKLNGWLSLPDDGFDMNLQLMSGNQSLKEVLTIVPGIYNKELKDYKSTGAMELKLSLKGKYTDLSYPGMEFLLKVDKASLISDKLPAKISDIHIDARITSPEGNNMDLAKVDIRNFAFKSGKNYLQLKSNLSNLSSDPNVELLLKGNLNIKEISDLIPIKSLIGISGQVKSDIYFRGTQKQITDKKYEKVNAHGHFTLSDFEMQNKSSKVLSISTMSMDLRPEKIVLNKLMAKYGQSDLAFTGEIDNLLSYILSDAVLKGNFNFSSNKIVLSDFSSDNSNITQNKSEIDSEANKVTADTSGLQRINIPENLDFNLNVNIVKLLIGRMNSDNVKGALTLKDGSAILKNIEMTSLGGMLLVNGSYRSGIEHPDADLDMAIQEVSFLETIKQIQAVSKLAPVFNNAKGNYSMKLKLNSKINKDFSPDLRTLLCDGFLKSKDVKVSDSPVLGKLVSTLTQKAGNQLSLKDLNIPFKIEDGNLITKPFQINAGDMNLKLSGKTNLSREIDYNGTAFLGDHVNIFGEGIKEVKFTITGSFSAPKVDVDFKNLTSTVVKSAAKTAVKELLNAKNDEELQKRINEIKSTAQKSADVLLLRADQEVENLQSKAKSALAKLAARKAGEQIKAEARKQADLILQKADKEIESLQKKL